MNADEKECPFCAEVIKAKAIKCRFCGADLAGKSVETKTKKYCPLCAEEFNASLSECPNCSHQKVSKDNQLKPSLNEGSLNKAGFWRRGAALLIDSLIFVTPLNLYFYLKSGGPLSNQIELILNPFYWLFSFLVAFLYFTVLNYKYGGTLGKLTLGLKIKKENNEDITYPQSLGRFFSMYLSVLLLGIGYLIQPFTQRKQALHDLLARTVVIDEKRKSGWIIFLIYVIYIGWSAMWDNLLVNKSVTEDDIAVIEKLLNEDNDDTGSNTSPSLQKSDDLSEVKEKNKGDFEFLYKKYLGTQIDFFDRAYSPAKEIDTEKNTWTYEINDCTYDLTTNSNRKIIAIRLNLTGYDDIKKEFISKNNCLPINAQDIKINQIDTIAKILSNKIGYRFEYKCWPYCGNREPLYRVTLPGANVNGFLNTRFYFNGYSDFTDAVLVDGWAIDRDEMTFRKGFEIGYSFKDGYFSINGRNSSGSADEIALKYVGDRTIFAVEVGWDE